MWGVRESQSRLPQSFLVSSNRDAVNIGKKMKALTLETSFESQGGDNSPDSFCRQSRGGA